MKKLWLISVLALGLVFVAGCTTTQKGSSDVMAVYNEAKEMTCTLTYTSDVEEWTSIIYVKDGMIKQDTKATLDGEEYAIYTLARDDKMYMWGDIYGEDAGFVVDYDLDVEEELWAFDEMEDGTTISCVKWVKKDSVFDLPSNISFGSTDNLLDLGEEDLLDLSEEVAEETIEEAEEVVEEAAEEATEEVEEVAEEVVEEVSEEAAE